MIFASNGAKIYFCTAPQEADLDATDYALLTFIEAKEAESIGSMSDAAAEIEFATLSAGRKQRLKGVRDAGVVEVVFGADYADAGQLALMAAEKTNSNYAIKVVFNDAPPAGTPSIRYFRAMVGTVAEVIDAADNVVKLNCGFWVNSEYTRINAAA